MPTASRMSALSPTPALGHCGTSLKCHADLRPPPRTTKRNPIDLNTVVMGPHHREATYLVRAKGHSITGAGINDGDELVVDGVPKPRNGSIVISV